jgi:hypothetical protein
MAPSDRPALEFEGNSAHSSGYWWAGQGPAIYIGGTLMYFNRTSDVLVYNPGRSTTYLHNTCSSKVGTTCTIAYLRLNNTKVFLANVGINHWGSRVELSGVEAHDTQRSVQVIKMPSVFS